jgi:hypothetical protein
MPTSSGQRWRPLHAHQHLNGWRVVRIERELPAIFLCSHGIGLLDAPFAQTAWHATACSRLGSNQ